MATDHPCLVALRTRYLGNPSDQDIFYMICDNINNDEVDIENLKCIIDHGQIDINLRHNEPLVAYGVTGLMNAVLSGNIEIVKLLCEKGADVMLANNVGNTALMLAQQDDDLERRNSIIEILTPYMQAAALGPVGGGGAAAAAMTYGPPFPLHHPQLPQYTYTSSIVPVLAAAPSPLSFPFLHHPQLPQYPSLPPSPYAEADASLGPVGGGGAAAVAVLNDRPAINTKMDQMPNAWRHTNLDDMTCPVCMGLYYNPLTFSCGHSLCRPCFEMLVGGPNRKCPECRQVIGNETPKINIVIQKQCDKLRALAAKHFSNSNYQYNNSFGFNSPRAGAKGGKRVTRKQRLFNSPKGGPKTRGIKYATAANARKSIKLIRGKDKTRRKHIAMQMYYRAKYHKYQTSGMRGAMKVWKKYMDSL